MMLLLALTAPAVAGEHWWGIGPSIGTMGLPLEYPAALPPFACKDDACDEPWVSPVTAELRAGAHGVYYIGNGARMGARLQLMGNFSTWGAQEATVEYEVILVKDDKFQLLGGGGVGFGHERFGAALEAEKNPDAYLDVTYFPIRGQLAVLWRAKTMAYEADLFATWHIAGDQVFSKSGDEADATRGTAVGGEGARSDAAIYAAVGAEVTVYFGNFRNKGGNKNDDDGKKKSKKKKKQ